MAEMNMEEYSECIDANSCAVVLHMFSENVLHFGKGESSCQIIIYAHITILSSPLILVKQ